jgi:hypothetical protein
LIENEVSDREVMSKGSLECAPAVKVPYLVNRGNPKPHGKIKSTTLRRENHEELFQR